MCFYLMQIFISWINQKVDYFSFNLIYPLYQDEWIFICVHRVFA